MGLKVNLTSPNFDCMLELEHKLTIIRGDSGEGKTTMVRKFEDYQSPNIQKFVDDDRVVLEMTPASFKAIVRKAEIFYKQNGLELPQRDSSENSKKRSEMLLDYWEKHDVMYEHVVIFVDDRDFATSLDFACLFNSDKTNYYVIITREKLASLGYSVDASYYFIKNGKSHYIVKEADYVEFESSNNGLKIVEGAGSDFGFFNNLYKSNNVISLAGRDNFEFCVRNFNNTTLNLFVDKCVFGDNYLDVINYCRDNNIKIQFAKGYESFEQFLLETNFFRYKNLQDYVKEHLLEFKSEEVLYTALVNAATNGTPMAYDKTLTKFKKCYIDDCCYGYKKANECIFFKKPIKSKVEWAIKGTKFEYLLEDVNLMNGGKV